MVLRSGLSVGHSSSSTLIWENLVLFGFACIVKQERAFPLAVAIELKADHFHRK